MNQQSVIEAADRRWEATGTGTGTATAPVRVDRETLSLGHAGAYSSFLRHAESAATIVDIALEHLKNRPSVPPTEQELSA